MTIENIKKLVSADELRTLELKKSTGELKNSLHSTCASLNTPVLLTCRILCVSAHKRP